MDSQHKYRLVQEDYDSVDISFQNSYDSTREFGTQVASFLSHIPGGGNILNVGGTLKECSYFADKSLIVTNLDVSQKMLDAVAQDPRITNLNGNIVSFQNYDLKQGFDGVWACRSLIHIPPSDIDLVLKNIHAQLAKGGVLGAVFFTSAKDTVEEEYTPEVHTQAQDITYYRVLYAIEEIRNRFTEQDFSVLKVDQTEDLDNEKVIYIEAIKL